MMLRRMPTLDESYRRVPRFSTAQRQSLLTQTKEGLYLMSDDDLAILHQQIYWPTLDPILPMEVSDAAKENRKDSQCDSARQ